MRMPKSFKLGSYRPIFSNDACKSYKKSPRRSSTTAGAATAGIVALVAGRLSTDDNIPIPNVRAGSYSAKSLSSSPSNLNKAKALYVTPSIEISSSDPQEESFLSIPQAPPIRRGSHLDRCSPFANSGSNQLEFDRRRQRSEEIIRDSPGIPNNQVSYYSAKNRSRRQLHREKPVMDEFEYYCQLAHSPGRSGSSSPPSPQDPAPVSPAIRPAQPFLSPPKNRPRSHSMLSTSPEEIFSDPNFPLVKTSFRSRSVKERRCSRATLLGQSEDSCLVVPTEPIIHLSAPGEHNSSNLEQQHLYRVRSFKRTSKGVVSQGDTIRTISSNTSMESCNSSNAVLSGSGSMHDLDNLLVLPQVPGIRKASFQGGYSSSPNGEKVTPSGAVFCIQVIGALGVGKSTLCRQFMTSEYLAAKDMPNEESEERFVSVRLDGAEWNLIFLDSVHNNDKDPMNVELLDSVDAYMVVYAIDDHASFTIARQILHDLFGEVKRSSTLFLVANKSDLVRGREVPNEVGKDLANIYQCKFLEVSTVLNHLVDDLLVGVVTQIRNQILQVEKEKQKLQKKHRGESVYSRSPGTRLTNFLRKHFSTKSCENLSCNQFAKCPHIN